MGEIQELTSISEWSHVDIKDNPADIISRGLEPNQMLDNTLWWESPNWLKCDSSLWPSTNKINDSRIVEEHQIINFSTAKQSELSFFFRYSNWNQLLRVIALCLRFVFNTVHPKNKKTGPLLPDDLANAVSRQIRAVQREHWFREISDFFSLTTLLG